MLDPNLAITDDFGYTVMHYACLGGNKACFDLLAEKAEELGLDVDATSEGGDTCLMAAIRRRKKKKEDEKEEKKKKEEK